MARKDRPPGPPGAHDESNAPTVGMSAVQLRAPLGDADTDHEEDTAATPGERPAAEDASAQTILEFDREEIIRAKIEAERLRKARANPPPESPPPPSATPPGGRRPSALRASAPAPRPSAPPPPRSSAPPAGRGVTPATPAGGVKAPEDSTLLDLEFEGSAAALPVRPSLAPPPSPEELRAIHDFLRSTFLGGLGPSAMKDLHREVQPLEVEGKKLLFAEGDAVGPVYLLRRGRLKVTRRYVAGPALADELEVGDAVGLQSCFLGTPREMTVETEGPCALVAISREGLLRVAAAHPETEALVRAQLGAEPSSDDEASLQLDLTRVREADQRRAVAEKRRAPAAPAPTRTRPETAKKGSPWLWLLLALLVAAGVLGAIVVKTVRTPAAEVRVDPIR